MVRVLVGTSAEQCYNKSFKACLKGLHIGRCILYGGGTIIYAIVHPWKSLHYVGSTSSVYTWRCAADPWVFLCPHKCQLIRGQWSSDWTTPLYLHSSIWVRAGHPRLEAKFMNYEFFLAVRVLYIYRDQECITLTNY